MSKNTTSKKKPDKITMPFAECERVTDEQWEIYSRFMRHFRHVPVSRMEIKILSALQFTADMTDCSDAHVSKVLVDLGLRAPRSAFPMEFLNYIDRAQSRIGWDVGSPSDAMIALHDQWFQDQGKSVPRPFRHIYSIVKDDVFC